MEVRSVKSVSEDSFVMEEASKGGAGWPWLAEVLIDGAESIESEKRLDRKE